MVLKINVIFQNWPKITLSLTVFEIHDIEVSLKGRLFVYGRPSGSASSAFCFPYNSLTVRRILFKFGRFRQ